MVSPLFDFILAAVTDTEVGSASGVLNARPAARRSARRGRRSARCSSPRSSHSGFVPAISHSLVAELATTPVLLALMSMLPARARASELEAASRHALLEAAPAT